MTFRDALLIGLAQCCSLIPGVSRSGATIIGGMLCGLSRKAATEFSFFLAVPTLIAAGGYDLMKHRGEFSVDDIELLAVGLIVSFISALICIRWLSYVASRFLIFAWARIILGVIILIVSGRAHLGASDECFLRQAPNLTRRRQRLGKY
jgi:undecaprenyl-diphosphatase